MPSGVGLDDLAVRERVLTNTHFPASHVSFNFLQLHSSVGGVNALDFATRTDALLASASSWRSIVRNAFFDVFPFILSIMLLIVGITPPPILISVSPLRASPGRGTRPASPRPCGSGDPPFASPNT